MSYSNRIFIYGPVGLLLLLLVLYSVFWQVQADTLAARLDRANGGEVIPGLVFAFAEKSVGGYPFRLDAVLSGVTFSHQTPEGETAWRTEKLALHRMAYGQNRYIFEAAGLQSFARPPEKPGTVPRVAFVTPGLARASAILAGGKLARFDLDLVQVQGREATQGGDPKRSLAADRAQIHFLSRPDDTIDVAVQIDNAHIGAAISGTNSEIVLPLINGRAKLTQSEALDALLSGGMSLADAASAWRDASGAVSVSDLAVNWRDAHTDLKGDLKLDAETRLSGVLEGNGVKDGKTPSSYRLAFADGAMRMIAGPAPSTPAGASP